MYQRHQTQIHGRIPGTCIGKIDPMGLEVNLPNLAIFLKENNRKNHSATSEGEKGALGASSLPKRVSQFPGVSCAMLVMFLW